MVGSVFKAPTIVIKGSRRGVIICFLQLQRSADNEEAQQQLMKTHELVGLQEEAHAAYHQGDYSTTINVLERLIEVTVNARMESNAAERHIMHIFVADVRKELLGFRVIDGLSVVFLFFQDLSLGSRLAGAPCGMLHPNGGPSEGHPGSDANHKAAQRQPRRLPEAQHAALHPGRAPRLAQVGGNVQAFVIHAGASDPPVSLRPFICSLQQHPRVSEAGPGRQGVLQPLQAGEEAEQAAGFSRGVDRVREVGAPCDVSRVLDSCL